MDLTGKDYYGLTALHKLCSWDKPNCVALLMKLIDGADERMKLIEAKDAEGNNAMSMCASEKCVKILLENSFLKK